MIYGLIYYVFIIMSICLLNIMTVSHLCRVITFLSIAILSDILQDGDEIVKSLLLGMGLMHLSCKLHVLVGHILFILSSNNIII